MTYANATEFMTRFDAAEIAQRVDRGVPRMVTGELLGKVAAGASLDGHTPSEIARAQTGMSVVLRALMDADDTINGYLSARYTLPLAPVPAVLQRVACELARFYLYDDQVTDLIKDRHAANVKWLGEVSRGTVSLGADAATGEQPVSSAGAELVSGERVWARHRSQGFI
ncbi:MAG: gp436 family protein [Polaromonas sp.]